jgi:hypothetical protein
MQAHQRRRHERIGRVGQVAVDGATHEATITRRIEPTRHRAVYHRRRGRHGRRTLDGALGTRRRTAVPAGPSATEPIASAASVATEGCITTTIRAVPVAAVSATIRSAVRSILRCRLSADLGTVATVGTVAARSAVATLVAMTSTVARTPTAVGAVRPLGPITKRTIRARLGTFRAAGGRIGRPVEGAIISIRAV